MENIESKHKQVILIKKASGEEEIFSAEKLRRSLLNAGAREETIVKIVKDIENWISPGINTKKIYTRAFSILRGEKTISSLKYRLKQAILELGPTGYPFETLIGELFKRQGFTTEVGVVLKGKCVSHEMDVIATKIKIQHLVECKYHKDQGKHVSIQVPLYVRSRVNDIIDKRREFTEYKDFSFSGWVVTNTSFSPDSINFGRCASLKLLAWNYPPGNGLKENIEKYKIYPITILKSLNIKEKKSLLEQGIVTCYQLLDNSEKLNVFKLSKTKSDRLRKELNEIIS